MKGRDENDKATEITRIDVKTLRATRRDRLYKSWRSAWRLATRDGILGAANEASRAWIESVACAAENKSLSARLLVAPQPTMSDTMV